MITLYKANEIDFSHNGLGILKDTIKADVKEEINGNFTLDLEYPLHCELSNELVRGNIIKCPVADNREDQLFRIRRPIKNLRSISVYAEHITVADLSKNFVRDTNIVEKTRVEALKQILFNCMEKHRFVGSGNAGGKQDTLRIVRYSPMQAILSTEDNTLLRRYGGEIEFDNFNIKVVDQRGGDNNVLICYGKNVVGIEETVDDTDLATCIIPEGANGLLLPEYYINSPLISNYEKTYYKTVKIDNIGVVEPSDTTAGVTQDEACSKLRQAVQRMYSIDKVDIPVCNYRVNFISLANTEEYKNYSVLEKVAIGDIVTIKHTKMNIDLKARVISYIYNALLDKYVEIELGFKKQNITDVIQDTQKEITSTKEQIQDTKEGLENNIEKTSQGLKLQIKNTKDGLQNNIDVTAEGLKGEIKNTKDGLENKLNVTANGLKGELKDTKNKLQSDISASARELTIQFQDGDRQLNSRVDQTARSLTAQVNNVKDNVNSQINMMDREISSKVSEGEVYSIVKQSPDAVKYAFNDISSSVTIDRNGLTVTNGRITADAIQGGQFDGDKVRFGDITCAQIHSRGHADLQEGCSVGGDIYASGVISCGGLKKCIQHTEHHGDISFYSLEYGESYLGDKGFGHLVNGECRIDIDPRVIESVNTDIYYHVKIDLYGECDRIWTDETHRDYFIVKGSHDIRFGWTLDGKRRGYEKERLNEVDYAKPREFGGEV